MRNLSVRRTIILGIAILIISNVLTAILVCKNIKTWVLEEQFMLSMCLANDYFESFEQSGSSLDKEYAVSAWGTAVQIAFQFDTDSRVFRERSVLNHFYSELHRDDTDIPISSLKNLCKKLAENPYDMTAYAELTELLNLISYKK